MATVWSLVVNPSGNWGPALTVEPNPVKRVGPGVATFSAAASGSPAPAVQWQVSTNRGSSFTNVPGATNATLTVAASLSDNGKVYRAVFASGNGSIATRSALLVVLPSNPLSLADVITCGLGARLAPAH